MSNKPDQVTVADGKYTVINDNGKLTALRHGEPWGRDLVGDNLVYWMVIEILQLKAKLDEVHSWIVCAPIATAEDMMQNAPRIIEITAPAQGDEL